MRDDGELGRVAFLAFWLCALSLSGALLVVTVRVLARAASLVGLL